MIAVQVPGGRDRGRRPLRGCRRPAGAWTAAILPLGSISVIADPRVAVPSRRRTSRADRSPDGHGERDLLVRPRDTELVDERRAARVQRHRAGLVGRRVRVIARDVSVHDLRRARRALVTLTVRWVRRARPVRSDRAASVRRAGSCPVGRAAAATSRPGRRRACSSRRRPARRSGRADRSPCS